MKDANTAAAPEVDHQRGPDEPVVLSAAAAPVRLSELLSAVLKQEEQAENVAPVVRMDQLPLVDADPAELKAAFQTLLSTIVQHPPQGSRLFLHIKCENTGVRLVDAEQKKTVLRFLVSLHTNIAAGQQWLQQHQAQLAALRLQFSCNRITLDWFPENTTGCLFMLTIPGKPDF